MSDVTQLAPIETWWLSDPSSLMMRIYHGRQRMPPQDKTIYRKEWRNIAKQLQQKHPATHITFFNRLHYFDTPHEKIVAHLKWDHSTVLSNCCHVKMDLDHNDHQCPECMEDCELIIECLHCDKPIGVTFITDLPTFLKNKFCSDICKYLGKDEQKDLDQLDDEIQNPK